MEVIRSDAMKFLVNNDELFDIVFLRSSFWNKLAGRFTENYGKKNPKDDSLIYIEGERGLRSPEGWTVLKKSNSQNVDFMLLERAN